MFDRIGERNPDRAIARLHELTRCLWQGERAEGFHDYDGRIPIVATGLKRLREYGPAGPALLRLGRTHLQPLRDAIGNLRREAAQGRAREAAGERQGEYLAV
ncbi:MULTISPECIES: hypothetical protein [Streptomyces]|uniref:hypothetical protein n=1 Tax=Streptomyces TaxID=1883 RepID=UPI001679D2C7|nr:MULTISPECIES: hypothetical protein [Streptomyces]MBK3521018.1 hypothetical protein [Streptomyces sp. MBT70]GGS13288.1 hypothetical protein GCM10010236_79570 [Streptomyces eurythermus]